MMVLFEMCSRTESGNSTNLVENNSFEDLFAEIKSKKNAPSYTYISCIP